MSVVDEETVKNSMALSMTELEKEKYFEEDSFIPTSSPTDV